MSDGRAVPRDRLVEAYWTHYALSTSQVREDRVRAQELWWAWETVSAAVSDGDPASVGLLVALAEAAPSDEALGYLGAGPFEEFLGWCADDRLAAMVETVVRRSPQLRQALRSVYLDDEVDEEFAARLRRFRGPAGPRP